MAISKSEEHDLYDANLVRRIERLCWEHIHGYFSLYSIKWYLTVQPSSLHEGVLHLNEECHER